MMKSNPLFSRLSKKKSKRRERERTRREIEYIHSRLKELGDIVSDGYEAAISKDFSLRPEELDNTMIRLESIRLYAEAAEILNSVDGFNLPAEEMKREYDIITKELNLNCDAFLTMFELANTYSTESYRLTVSDIVRSMIDYMGLESTKRRAKGLIAKKWYGLSPSDTGISD